VALLWGEDAIGLGGGDGEGPCNRGELFLLDEAGVGDVADLDAGLIVAEDELWAGWWLAMGLVGEGWWRCL